MKPTKITINNRLLVEHIGRQLSDIYYGDPDIEEAIMADLRDKLSSANATKRVDLAIDKYVEKQLDALAIGKYLQAKAAHRLLKKKK